MRSVERAHFLGVLLLCVICASSGCRSGKKSSRSNVDDSSVACASACAALRCGSSGASARKHEFECAARCHARSREVEAAGCGALERAFLACVSAAPVECGAAGGSAATALEHGAGVSACRASFERLSECLVPCTLQGTVELSALESGAAASSIEVFHGGCRPCGEKRPDGAPEGSDCSASSVCDSACCDCPNRGTHYRVRACLAGRCAGHEQACRFVPKAARACLRAKAAAGQPPQR
jgi:hypothetical protein